MLLLDIYDQGRMENRVFQFSSPLTHGSAESSYSTLYQRLAVGYANCMVKRSAKYCSLRAPGAKSYPRIQESSRISRAQVAVNVSSKGPTWANNYASKDGKFNIQTILYAIAYLQV